jgi:hypothetical protein
MTGVDFMLLLLIGGAAPATLPPAKSGQCGWVHGRYAVYNGSSVRRIWVIATHRVVALADDDQDIPPEIAQYQQDPAGGALFGDFYVCALEPSRPGHMQHIRLGRTRNLIFRGRPYPPK